MAEHHLARQAEREAELSDFVLEELAQRLEELEVQRLGEAADVVVRLDGGRLPGLAAGGLDDVGVDRSLGEPLRVADPLCFALKDLDEQAANDLAFLLRVDNVL